MKKTKSILAVVTLCIICLLGFSGCGKKKTPVSAEKFRDTLESKGFIVSSSTSAYSQNKDVTESYIAISPDYKYQIEFIVTDSVSGATRLYNTNKSKFEFGKSSSGLSKNKSIELANYATYSLVTGGKYQVISRIDNTLIYVNVDEQYQESVKSVLNDLGY